MKATAHLRKNAGLSVLGGIGLIASFGVGIGVLSRFHDLGNAIHGLSIIGFLILMPAVGLIVRGGLMAATGRTWHDARAVLRLAYIVFFVPFVLIALGLALFFLITGISGY